MNHRLAFRRELFLPDPTDEHLRKQTMDLLDEVWMLYQQHLDHLDDPPGTHHKTVLEHHGDGWQSSMLNQLRSAHAWQPIDQILTGSRSTTVLERLHGQVEEALQALKALT